MWHSFHLYTSRREPLPFHWNKAMRHMFRIKHRILYPNWSNATEVEHNATHSHLPNLPVEIILMIDSYLDNIDLVALRLTCREFFYILPHGAWILSNDDRALWKRLLQYQKMCSLEKMSKKRGLDVLVCGLCKSSHPAALFSQEQRRRDPEDRVCIGTEGLLKICSHVTVTYDTLRDIVEKCHARSIAVTICCSTIDHDVFLIETKIGNHNVQDWRRSRGTNAPEYFGMPELNYEKTIIAVPHWKTEVRTEELAAALNRLQDYICPHVRLDDPIVLWACPPMCLGSCHGPYHFCDNCSQGYIKCPVQACETRFMLYRERRTIQRFTGGDYLKVNEYKLHVRRNFPLNDPAHPAWLAQLCMPSEDHRQLVETSSVALSSHLKLQ